MGDYFNGLVRSASMSFDTSIIYFSSGSSYPGVPKFGANADLFVLRNTPLAWDSVDNLGMPVNSYEREIDVAITADGEYLYFSSTRDTLKPLPDIYVSHWLPTWIEEEVGEVGVGVQHFSLSPAFPNPFNSSTALTVTLIHRSPVRVDVYDLLGRHVANLLRAQLSPGTHIVRWRNAQAGSGVYVVRAQTDEGSVSTKVLLLK
jgi:hypothetical protein